MRIALLLGLLPWAWMAGAYFFHIREIRAMRRASDAAAKAAVDAVSDLSALQFSIKQRERDLIKKYQEKLKKNPTEP